MEVKLYIKKSIEENASMYFESAKKAKKKIEGAKIALIDSEKKLLKAKLQQEKVVEKKIIERKKHWYHKFRWFFTSEGFLVIGGRDAATNEIVIKKHATEGDLVFHTDMSGSPFVVIKEGQKAGEKSIQEAADFTAAHSKGWKMGLASLRVFYVTPEQVTKEANTGEYLSKGSFMIRGKTTYVDPTMNFGICIVDNWAMGAPISALKEPFIELIQGDGKVSDVAKKLKKTLNYDDVDDLIRVMPNGCKIKK